MKSMQEFTIVFDQSAMILALARGFVNEENKTFEEVTINDIPTVA